MKYSQGKLQSIIYRSKNTALSIVALCIVTIIGAVLGIEPSDGFMTMSISALIIVPVLVTLWIFVFNSGKSSTDEYAIEFTNEGIEYLNMAEKDTVTWSDYKKYEISGVFRKTLTIYSKERKLAIDLMLFNSRQCKQIISTLNERVSQHNNNRSIEG